MRNSSYIKSKDQLYSNLKRENGVYFFALFYCFILKIFVLHFFEADSKKGVMMLRFFSTLVETQEVYSNNCQFMELYWNYGTPKTWGGGRFHDIGFENDFLDMTSKAQKKNKQKQANGTTSNLKTFRATKEIVPKIWKMSQGNGRRHSKIINKGIISRIKNS